MQLESILNTDAFVHDILGHGVIGLCHIEQARIGGNPVSLMLGGPGAFNGSIADNLSAASMVATRSLRTGPGGRCGTCEVPSRGSDQTLKEHYRSRRTTSSSARLATSTIQTP